MTLADAVSTSSRVLSVTKKSAAVQAFVSEQSIHFETEGGISAVAKGKSASRVRSKTVRRAGLIFSNVVWWFVAYSSVLYIIGQYRYQLSP